MEDLMIDLETLGQTPNTPVISLGACFFDIKTGQIGNTFYMVMDVSEQIERGRKPDGSTLKWWMQQTDAAKKVFSEHAKPVDVVLGTFQQWYKQNNSKAKVWGNGSTFDISILEDMYRMYKIKCPWLFYNIMDLRTFKRFNGKGEKVMKSGVNHNALDDALSQAKYVIQHSRCG